MVLPRFKPVGSGKASGQVFLVGAGPGDPDLLTIRAWRCLQQADVVLYDALISPGILALVSTKAELLPVGKRAGQPSHCQDDICRRMIALARRGLMVVRLKGGDPFIFGRGGEELQQLTQANIHAEVIPGVTAASGAVAIAGIPLTHRDYARSVSFIAGQGAGDSGFDWQPYVAGGQTLVIYMGFNCRAIISQQLIAAGMPPATPVAIISRACSTAQQVFTGQLANLARLCPDDNKLMPALIIIGEVVNCRQSEISLSEPALFASPSPWLAPVERDSLWPLESVSAGVASK